MTNMTRDRLDRIAQLSIKRHEIEREIMELIGSPEAPKATRKVSDYSISQLVMELMSDGLKRGVPQMTREIHEKTGHSPTQATVRSAAKYMVKQGKMTMDQLSKEFQLIKAVKTETPVDTGESIARQ